MQIGRYMLMKYSLAFDFGATSVRAILGSFADGKITIKEVMRLSHKRVLKDGRYRWEWDKLINQVKSTILTYHDKISSIAVNTWGVDFGLIGHNGRLLNDPISYRDPKHEIGFEKAISKKTALDIFLSTGNQIMPINTLFQLLTLKEENEVNFEEVNCLLMLPDLINYLLTGEKRAEISIASTTQLLDLGEIDYAYDLINDLGLKTSIFAPLIEQGAILGTTKGSLIKELRTLDIPVITVASHDTASATLISDSYLNSDVAFLSCGTWSLIGTFTERAMIFDEVYDANLTNEIGFDYSNMFFKNITGLYVVELLKEQLEESLETEIDYDEITAHVENNKNEYTVDIEDPVFAQNSFDVIETIDELLDRHFDDPFDYFKIVYLSLAKAYCKTLTSIENITQQKFKKIHIIGGGAKSQILCSLIAKHSLLPVKAGPFESTALGNLLVQQLALGEISSIEEGLQLIRKSYSSFNYEP